MRSSAGCPPCSWASLIEHAHASETEPSSALDYLLAVAQHVRFHAITTLHAAAAGTVVWRRHGTAAAKELTARCFTFQPITHAPSRWGFYCQALRFVTTHRLSTRSSSTAAAAVPCLTRCCYPVTQLSSFPLGGACSGRLDARAYQ